MKTEREKILYLNQKKTDEMYKLRLKPITFEKWYDHYEYELENLYELFEKKCKSLDLDFYQYINYETFVNFVFNNSTIITCSSELRFGSDY